MNLLRVFYNRFRLSFTRTGVSRVVSDKEVYSRDSPSTVSRASPSDPAHPVLFTLHEGDVTSRKSPLSFCDLLNEDKTAGHKTMVSPTRTLTPYDT